MLGNASSFMLTHQSRQMHSITRVEGARESVYLHRLIAKIWGSRDSRHAPFSKKITDTRVRKETPPPPKENAVA